MLEEPAGWWAEGQTFTVRTVLTAPASRCANLARPRRCRLPQRAGRRLRCRRGARGRPVGCRSPATDVSRVVIDSWRLAYRRGGRPSNSSPGPPCIHQVIGGWRAQPPPNHPPPMPRLPGAPPVVERRAGNVAVQLGPSGPCDSLPRQGSWAALYPDRHAGATASPGTTRRAFASLKHYAGTPANSHVQDSGQDSGLGIRAQGQEMRLEAKAWSAFCVLRSASG